MESQESRYYMSFHEQIERLLNALKKAKIEGTLVIDPSSIESFNKAIQRLEKALSGMKEHGWINKNELFEAFRGVVSQPSVVKWLGEPNNNTNRYWVKTLSKWFAIMNNRLDVNNIGTAKAVAELWKKYQVKPMSPHMYTSNVQAQKILDRFYTFMDNSIDPLKGMAKAYSGGNFNERYLRAKYGEQMLEGIFGVPKNEQYKPFSEWMENVNKRAWTGEYGIAQEIYDLFSKQLGYLPMDFDKLIDEMTTQFKTIFTYTNMKWDDRFVRDIISSYSLKDATFGMALQENPELMDKLVKTIEKLYKSTNTYAGNYISTTASTSALSDFVSTLGKELNQLDRRGTSVFQFNKFYDKFAELMKSGLSFEQAVEKMKKKAPEWLDIPEQLTEQYITVIVKAWDRGLKTLGKKMVEDIQNLITMLEKMVKALPEDTRGIYEEYIRELKERKKIIATDQFGLSQSMEKLFTKAKTPISGVLGGIAEQREAKKILDVTMASISVVMTFTTMLKSIEMTADAFRKMQVQLETFGASLNDIITNSQAYNQALIEYNKQFGELPKDTLAQVLQYALSPQQIMQLMTNQYSSALGKLNVEQVLSKWGFDQVVMSVANQSAMRVAKFYKDIDSLSKLISGTFTIALLDVTQKIPLLSNAISLVLAGTKIGASILQKSANTMLALTGIFNYLLTLSKAKEFKGIPFLARTLLDAGDKVVSAITEFFTTGFGKALLKGGLVVGAIAFAYNLAKTIGNIFEEYLRKKVRMQLEQEGKTMSAVSRLVDEIDKFDGAVKDIKQALQSYYQTVQQMEKYKLSGMSVEHALEQMSSDLQSVLQPYLDTYNKILVDLQAIEQAKKRAEYNFKQATKIAGSVENDTMGLLGAVNTLDELSDATKGIFGAFGLRRNTLGKIDTTYLQERQKQLEEQKEKFKAIVDFYTSIQEGLPTTAEEVKELIVKGQVALSQADSEKIKSQIQLVLQQLKEYIKVLSTFKYKFEDAIKENITQFQSLQAMANALSTSLRDTTLSSGLNKAIGLFSTMQQLFIQFGQMLDTVKDPKVKAQLTQQYRQVFRTLYASWSNVSIAHERAVYQTIQQRINAVSNFWNKLSDNLLGGVGKFLTDIYKLYNTAEGRKILQKRYGLTGAIKHVEDLLNNEQINATLQIKAQQTKDSIIKQINDIFDYQKNKLISAYKQFGSTAMPFFSGIFSKGLDTLFTMMTRQGQYQFSIFSNLYRRLQNTYLGHFMVQSEAMKKAILKNDPIAFAVEVMKQDINKSITSLPSQIRGSEFLNLVLSSLSLEHLGRASVEDIVRGFKDAFDTSDWEELAEKYAQSYQDTLTRLSNINTAIKTMATEFGPIITQLEKTGTYLQGIKDINQEFKDFVPEADKVKNAIGSIQTAFDDLVKKMEQTATQLEGITPEGQKLAEAQKFLQKTLSEVLKFTIALSTGDIIGWAIGKLFGNKEQKKKDEEWFNKIVNTIQNVGQQMVEIWEKNQGTSTTTTTTGGIYNANLGH